MKVSSGVRRTLAVLVAAVTATALILAATSPAEASTVRPMYWTSNAHIWISVEKDFQFYTAVKLQSVPSGNSVYGHWAAWNADDPSQSGNTAERWWTVSEGQSQIANTWRHTCATFWVHGTGYTEWGPALCAFAY